MKKIVSILMAAALISVLMLAGCQSASTDNAAKTAEPSKTEEAAATEKAAPTEEAAATEEAVQTQEPAQTEGTSGKVSIEIMTSPWVGSPLGEDDPYKKWLDEHFGADFTLNATAEFQTEILTRFASDDPPDIFDCGKNDLYKLYDQGVLVTDWNPYLASMPTAAKNIGDMAKTYFTRDGKLICLPALAGEQKWCFNIRGDWLASLKLQMPATVDDLIKVARAFTKDDPDKNGAADTYAFTSAGGGTNLGEIGNLACMFGPVDFYVGKDGKVQHPILDGNHEKFLKLLKQIVDEKLIDPDWYTQGWDERKPNLYKGMFGITWYPPMALLTETDVSRQNDGVVLNWWDVMSIPAAGDMGGKLPGLSAIGVLRSCSSKAEKDAAKWDVIMRFFEETAFPNEGYSKLRWGVDIDGFKLVPLDGGYNYLDLLGKVGDHRRGEREGQSIALYNWGKVICTYSDKVITGSTPQPDKLVDKTVAMEQAIEKIGRHPIDNQYLDLDPDVAEEVNRIKNEFEINYILGKVTDYEAFRQQWLAGGGQTLIDAATEQFKAKGLIK